MTVALTDEETGQPENIRSVEVIEENILVLASTSPIRFRLEGLAGTMTFQLSDGWAVVLDQPGAPSLTLARDEQPLQQEG